MRGRQWQENRGERRQGRAVRMGDARPSGSSKAFGDSEPVGGRGPFMGELWVGHVVRKLLGVSRTPEGTLTPGTSSRAEPASGLPNRSNTASRRSRDEANQVWLPRHPGQGRRAEQAALARFAISQWEAGEGRRGAETAGGALSSPSQFLESLWRRRHTCAHPNGRTGLIKGSLHGARSTP